MSGFHGVDIMLSSTINRAAFITGWASDRRLNGHHLSVEETAGPLAVVRAAKYRPTILRRDQARRLLRERKQHSPADIDDIIEGVPDRVWFDPVALGKALLDIKTGQGMTVAEKFRWGLWNIAPIDCTREEEKAMLHERKIKRDRARRANRRVETGLAPRLKAVFEAIPEDGSVTAAQLGVIVSALPMFKGLADVGLRSAVHRALAELEAMGHIETIKLSGAKGLLTTHARRRKRVLGGARETATGVW